VETESNLLQYQTHAREKDSNWTTDKRSNSSKKEAYLQKQLELTTK
jgi:hypothetical protein